ncbi:hypothetical protein O1L60_46930 [Streptomyces diastatochromogenes]|nr:hypothetical protein [Streptomyces diastatochromogenes]
MLGEFQDPQRDHGQVAAGRGEDLGELLHVDVDRVGDDLPTEETWPCIDDKPAGPGWGPQELGARLLHEGGEIVGEAGDDGDLQSVRRRADPAHLVGLGGCLPETEESCDACDGAKAQVRLGIVRYRVSLQQITCCCGRGLQSGRCRDRFCAAVDAPHKQRRAEQGKTGCVCERQLGDVAGQVGERGRCSVGFPREVGSGHMVGPDLARSGDLCGCDLARDLLGCRFHDGGQTPRRRQVPDDVVGVSQREFQDVPDAESAHRDQVLIRGIGGVTESPQNHERMVELTRVNQVGPLPEREPHRIRRVVGNPAGGDAARGGRSQGSMQNAGEVSGARLLPFRSTAGQGSSPSQQQMIM